jgi:hypothetical protein
MRAALTSLFVPFALAGCEQVSPQPVDYQPELAGTVDHALCLLGYTGVPMREVATGHQLVEATLNGRPATFVVDTGANVSVVHAPLAEQFGLSGEGGRTGGAIGIGGGGAARQVRIESLSTGDIVLRQQRMVLTDLSQLTAILGPMSGGTISGIIGQDILSEHRAVIDVSRSMLHLIPEDRDPAPVPEERCQARDESEEANQTAATNRSDGGTDEEDR